MDRRVILAKMKLYVKIGNTIRLVVIYYVTSVSLSFRGQKTTAAEAGSQVLHLQTIEPHIVPLNTAKPTLERNTPHYNHRIEMES